MRLKWAPSGVSCHSRPTLTHCLISIMVWNSLFHGSTLSMAASHSQQQQAYAAVMNGITELNFESSSVPGVFILSGDHAFPLVVNSGGKIQAAASEYGAGRIVTLCHETYLTVFPDLVVNAINWLRGEGSDNMRVGVQERVKDVADSLTKRGFQVTVMEKLSSDQGFAAYVTDAYGTDGNDNELIAFMKSGGGLLMAAQAWHWSHTHPNDNAWLHYWGNKVSAVAGIYFSPEYGHAARISVGAQVPIWNSLDVSDTFKADLDALLKGVEELQFESRSLASEILVHGRLSFPIAWKPHTTVYLAGGYYGKGRVIVAGHENLVSDNEQFWENALGWLDQGRQGVVGVDPYLSVTALEKTNFTIEQTEFKAGLSVFVANSWRDSHIREIQQFVAEGGGLVLGGQAWTFVQRSQLNYLTECPGNKLLNPMGLTLLSSTLSGGVSKVPDSSSALKECHLRPLLDLYVGFLTQRLELTPEQEQSLSVRKHYINTFLQMLNQQSSSYRQIVSTLVDALKKNGLPQLSYTNSTSSARDKHLLGFVVDVYKVCADPDEMVRVLFQDPPQLPTVQDQRIGLSADTGEGQDWLSTGLYLSPGMRTNITVPAEMVNSGWEVQISCQTDDLNHLDELHRAPVVYERFPIVSETLEVHNFWGGLIYLIAPPNTNLSGVEVTVQQAVQAPHYKSGVTLLSDWLQLRSAASPWAELEFENIVLTVPSSVVRSLDRPDELATLWDKVMRAIADLSVIPAKFQRKERIVADVQISRGWMHAGYPIMMKTPRATLVTSLDEIRREGLWGPLHELGHNQQRAPTEFRPHTTEATCNLWSVYVTETVLGVGRHEYAAAELTQEYRSQITDEYVNNGKKLDDWNTWVALETYLQLQEKFGWEAFKKVFAAYHAMPEEQVPSDNPGKMKLYALTFSQAVGTDVTAFLKSWGWPIDADTEQKVSALPGWTDHPMVKYG